MFGLMLASFAFSGCMCAKPTHGVKKGVIISVAEEGLFVPTYEAQLIRGGLQGSSGAMEQAFDFNIKASPVLEAAQKALESGAEVEVEYERHLLTTIFDRENPGAPTAIRITVRGSCTETKQ
jgi:hypothetical protein